jgi:hypothetical protein
LISLCVDTKLKRMLVRNWKISRAYSKLLATAGAGLTIGAAAGTPAGIAALAAGAGTSGAAFGTGAAFATGAGLTIVAFVTTSGADRTDPRAAGIIPPAAIPSAGGIIPAGAAAPPDVELLDPFTSWPLTVTLQFLHSTEIK